MYIIVIEALTPLDRTSLISLYKNSPRSKLFCRIAKRSITFGNFAHFLTSTGNKGKLN